MYRILPYLNLVETNKRNESLRSEKPQFLLNFKHFWAVLLITHDLFLTKNSNTLKMHITELLKPENIPIDLKNRNFSNFEIFQSMGRCLHIFFKCHESYIVLNLQKLQKQQTNWQTRWKLQFRKQLHFCIILSIFQLCSCVINDIFLINLKHRWESISKIWSIFKCLKLYIQYFNLKGN